MSTRIVAIALVSMLAVTILAGCGSKVTKENFDKIQVGQSVEEVKGILGEPTNSSSAGAMGVSGEVHEWVDGEKKIVVTFANGKVTTMTHSGL